MDDFLKMDVFFAVTTAAVCILTVLVAIALLYAIRVLRVVERMVLIAEKETERVAEDLEVLRAKAKREGLKLRHIVGFLSDLRTPRKK